VSTTVENLRRHVSSCLLVPRDNRRCKALALAVRVGEACDVREPLFCITKSRLTHAAGSAALVRLSRLF